MAHWDTSAILKFFLVEAAYGEVLRECLLHTPPVFLRTNDALHLASARLAGETEFVTADNRQRAAALHLGFTVLS